MKAMVVHADDLPDEVISALFVLRRMTGHTPRFVRVPACLRQPHNVRVGIWQRRGAGLWSWVAD